MQLFRHDRLRSHESSSQHRPIACPEGARCGTSRGSLGNRSRARRAATRGSPRSVASSIALTSRRRSLDKRAKMRAESAIGSLCLKTVRDSGEAASPQGSGRTDPESTFRLIDRARSGDQEALEQLFGRYLKPLQRWARGRLPVGRAIWPTPTTLSRTPCVQTFKKIDGFEPRGVGALQAYLRQAVLNRIRDELRRKRRQPEMTELDGLEVDRAASPLEEAIGREAVDRYESALTAAATGGARGHHRARRDGLQLRGAGRGPWQTDRRMRHARRRSGRSSGWQRK